MQDPERTTRDASEPTVPALDRNPIFPHPAIPGYEIMAELGRGGMGIVYKARQQKLNRIVALKMVLGGGQASERELARFAKEAEAVARLQHPNIVQIFEVGDVYGCPYLSLEFVEGGPLSRRLTGAPWDGLQVAKFIQRLAHGVQVMHDTGIVHRDLKPANILLKELGSSGATDSSVKTDRGELRLTFTDDEAQHVAVAIPKITDFGLAFSMEASSGQTASGAFLGTPSYCSPEQATGSRDEIGPQSDVYALGAIMYELLTGRPPFRGVTLVETLTQVANQEPVSPRLLNPSVARDLETICLKCLSKRPCDRYESATMLAADLDRFLGNQPILARPAGTFERWWKWAKRKPAAALAGLLSMSVVGIGIALAVALVYQKELSEKNLALQSAANTAEEARDQAISEQAKVQQTNQQMAELTAELREQTAALERERQLGKRYLYDADMNLAERAWQDHRVARMVKLLEQQHSAMTEEDFRSFEWYYLRGLEQQELRRVSGNGFALSADRRRMAIINGQIVSLHDTSSLEVISPHFNLPTAIFTAVLSDDASLIAVACWDRSIHIWEVQSHKKLQTITLPKYVSGIAFSHDNQKLLTAEQSNVVRLWNLADGVELTNFTDHTTNVTAIDFTPDGQHWLSASSDQTLQRRSMSSNDRLDTETRLPESPWDFAIEPSGSWVAVGGEQSPITFWDLESFKQLPTPGGGNYNGMYLDVSRDGKMLATGDSRGTVRVWSLENGQLIRQFSGHMGAIGAVAFADDERTIISSSGDYTIRFWSLDGPSFPRVLRGHQGRISAIAFSPDEQTLVSAGGDGTVRLWTSEGSQTLFGHTAYVTDVAFLADGNRVTSSGSDGSLRVWNVADGTTLHTIPAHNACINELATSPDGKHIATVSDDYLVKVWASDTGKAVHTLKGHTDLIFSVAFHPNNDLLASGSQDGGIRLWDIQEGKQVGFLPEGNNSSVAFHPDGKTLVATVGVVFDLFDVEHQHMIYRSDAQQALVSDAVFTPDGQRLVTAHYDNVVRLWDAVSRREVLTLRDLPGPVHSIAVSSSGNQIAASVDNEIFLWDITKTKQQFGR